MFIQEWRGSMVHGAWCMVHGACRLALSLIAEGDKNQVGPSIASLGNKMAAYWDLQINIFREMNVFCHYKCNIMQCKYLGRKL
jgi:hypothetical protein